MKIEEIAFRNDGNHVSKNDTKLANLFIETITNVAIKIQKSMNLESSERKVVNMKKTRVGQENRNERTSNFIIIRDWLGFFFTVAGFCLSLSGTVHINIQTQNNIVIEVCNYTQEIDKAQWNSEDYLLNMKGYIYNTEKNDISSQKYPTGWTNTDLTECSYDILKRKTEFPPISFLNDIIKKRVQILMAKMKNAAAWNRNTSSSFSGSGSSKEARYNVR